MSNSQLQVPNALEDILKESQTLFLCIANSDTYWGADRAQRELFAVCEKGICTGYAILYGGSRNRTAWYGRFAPSIIAKMMISARCAHS